MFSPSEWPQWVNQLVWSAVTVTVAYVVGHVLNVMVATRLARLAARTETDWDDVAVRELRRRIPFWSVLVGLRLALAHWALSPAAEQIAIRVLSALGVISVTFAIAAVATRLVVNFGPRAAPGVPVSGLTQNLVRLLVTVMGLLVVVRSFGYDITPMLTALGVGGLAVALALQESLSNLFAGLFIALAGQVRIGDYVRLDSGAEGHIVDFNWRATRLRQLSNNIIVVPNSKLAQAVVTNFSLPAPDLGVGVDVTVDAASDLGQVERVAMDVASEVVRQAPGAVSSAAPAVQFQAFTDIGVRFSVGFRVREFTDQGAVRHELVKRLHARFAQEGIVLAVAPVVLSRPRE